MRGWVTNIALGAAALWRSGASTACAARCSASIAGTQARSRRSSLIRLLEWEALVSRRFGSRGAHHRGASRRHGGHAAIGWKCEENMRCDVAEVVMQAFSRVHGKDVVGSAKRRVGSAGGQMDGWRG